MLPMATAEAPASLTAALMSCSEPAPPVTTTGTVTLWLTDSISFRSKPLQVPSRSIE
ncbi:hypothetical protein D9M68_989950 [compost metagenome]